MVKGIRFVSLALYWTSVKAGDTSPFSLQAFVPEDAPDPLPEAFLSYSIELCFFPDFAGNLTNPNNFSKNLLQNLAAVMGTMPQVRVGGNTQDRVTYDKDMKSGILNDYEGDESADQPAHVTIGPAFFESFQTFPETSFYMGLNWADGGNSSAGLKNVLEAAVAGCGAIGDKLIAWEYGNEPDMYSSPWDDRPEGWTEEEAFAEWKAGTTAINDALQEHCPSSGLPDSPNYIAPSFVGDRALDIRKYWEAGLNKEKDVKYFAAHNYVGAATDPGLTLQSTLMNHSNTIDTLKEHLEFKNVLNGVLPYVLGETNSLARQGKPGISDAFGSALWNVDFALQCAASSIYRINMHQGLNYRYASWQPIDTQRAPKATRPAYYGNIATAAFLGDLTTHRVQVVELEMPDPELDAGYGAYIDGKLARIALINLRTYNGTTSASTGPSRPEQKYSFSIPWAAAASKAVKLDRLMAPGSDALSGITFRGFSYNYELDEGRPVALENVTVGESVDISEKGLLEVLVPDASAVLVNLAGP